MPIVLGFIDYRRKRVGFGPLLTPSGDLEADLQTIRSFYDDKIGKRPENKGEIALRPSEPA